MDEIMAIVESISGVQLGPEKRLVVETRLFRRARLLGLESVDSYLEHFRANREGEVRELVSLMTTHTTEFFRESAHFDYLYSEVFPKLLKRGAPVKFWSAASSSGEEVYSLAISWLEFAREHGGKVPRVEFMGTDIDFASVNTAREGIYNRTAVANLNEELVRRYFDVGEGDLAGAIRVKDEVHALCRFEQMNLLSHAYPVKDADVVLLRNVLIYFKPEDIEAVAGRLAGCIRPDGYLFLGHSESLMNLKSAFVPVSNAVYRFRAAVAQQAQAAPESRGLGIAAAPRAPTRVLIVDDSRPIRMMLKKILSAEHGFQVIGEASNPLEAEELLKTLKPDLMTLDIHMPEMDGITYLEKMNRRGHQFPVVMISSISYEEAVGAFRCFDLGAVDFIEKPKGGHLAHDSERIRAVLRDASTAKRRASPVASITRHDTTYTSSADWLDLIVIGASTGGPEAIQKLLPLFPAETPPILVVQHIPAAFSGAFAKRMNEISHLRCKEAQTGDVLKGSHLYIAPGGKQLKLVMSGRTLRLEVNDDPPVNRHQPSVDYLFGSVAALRRSSLNVSAAVLTGMGADGAAGLKALRDWGAHTIAQDEDSSVVFGMPKEAIALGGAAEVLPLLSIPHHLVRALSKLRAA